MKRPDITPQLLKLWRKMDKDATFGNPWTAEQKDDAEQQVLRQGKRRSFWYGFTHPFGSNPFGSK